MKNYVIGGLCFLAGVVLGYIVFGIEKGATADMDMMGDMSTTSPMHMHTMLEVDTSIPIPTISVVAIKDAKDGYNLHITTENYTFTPENVNKESVQSQGHAHIHVNDIKVARLYGNWFNLPASYLQDGENIIKVTLNANDHSEWVIDNLHISSTITVLK
jgi:hypothetical protein